MSKVKIEGHGTGTGTFTVTTPSSNTDRTITLPDSTGTLLTTTGSGANLTGVGVDGISSSADATAITIDSSERVGVGTASPTEKLQVHGAIRSTNNATTTLADSGNFYYIPTADDASNPRTVISAVGTSSVGGHVTFKTGTSSSNTEKVRILSSGGITFNGDTAAANALDDYEEGTWTPAIGVGSGISIGTNYASNYTKIGNVCTLSASFTLASSSVPASGDVRITGFPFSFKSFPEGTYPINMYYTYRQTPGLYMHNAGYIYYQNSTVGGNNVQAVGDALDATNFLSLTFSYLTT